MQLQMGQLVLRYATGAAGDSVEALEEKLLASKKGKMPVVDNKGGLVGLLTRASLKEKKLCPKAGLPSLDKQGRLLCGAAIGTREVGLYSC